MLYVFMYVIVCFVRLPKCCQVWVDDASAILTISVAKKKALEGKLLACQTELKQSQTELHQVKYLQQAQEQEAAQEAARHKKQRELNMAAYDRLKAQTDEELKKQNAACNLLRAQIVNLEQRLAATAKAPQGVHPLVSRSVCMYSFSSFMLEQAHLFKREWRELYPTHYLTAGLSGEFAYGEPTLGTMGRICCLISSELATQRRPLRESDVLLDWGCGSGKWLIFAREFLQLPRMAAIGIEAEERIFEICSSNLQAAKRGGRTRLNALYARSESFASFCPVTDYTADGVLLPFG